MIENLTNDNFAEKTAQGLTLLILGNMVRTLPDARTGCRTIVRRA